MSSNDVPVHYGWLLVPPQAKILLKKTWTQKYCLLFKASKFGIERLEIYDDEVKSKAFKPKIITLENCVKLCKSHTCFTIVTKSGEYEFGATTDKSLTEWLDAIQSVAFPTASATSLVEDNDLYCSFTEGIFSVKLFETDASQRCHLQPKEYTLMLTAIAIQLRDIIDNKLLFTWPYQYVRRYGYSNGKFTFEAGRKCDSGEGTFHFEYSNEQEIFRCVTNKIKSMKQLIRSDSMPMLDCDKQLQQAVSSMEARSRSPMPPQIISRLAPEIPPKKPPRKHLSKNDYDEVETRSNAWVTLGTSEITHDEAESSRVVTQSECESDSEYDYDRLNFLGSTNRLHMSYKQVSKGGSSSNVSTPGAGVHPALISFNEYDEVGTANMSIRPADDSYLGYATVRKVENDAINHKSINDTEYAIISKPKRV